LKHKQIKQTNLQNNRLQCIWPSLQFDLMCHIQGSVANYGPPRMYMWITRA